MFTIKSYRQLAMALRVNNYNYISAISLKFKLVHYDMMSYYCVKHYIATREEYHAKVLLLSGLLEVCLGHLLDGGNDIIGITVGHARVDWESDNLVVHSLHNRERALDETKLTIVRVHVHWEVVHIDTDALLLESRENLISGLGDLVELETNHINVVSVGAVLALNDRDKALLAGESVMIPSADSLTASDELVELLKLVDTESTLDVSKTVVESEALHLVVV